MYSCNPIHKNQEHATDSSKERKCRFDGRNTETHQSLGCQNCPRTWDTEYLEKMGLLK